MGWFDEQIKQRKQSDNEIFQESFLNMADAVLGRKTSFSIGSDDVTADNALHSILNYYGGKSKSPEIPPTVKSLDDRLEYLLRPHGIMRRNVTLEKGWYKNAAGAMLGRHKDNGNIVALIPRGLFGYSYLDSATGKWIRIGKKNESYLEEKAICFYRPFPLKKLNIRDLSRYIVTTLSMADLTLTAMATLALSLIGLLTPLLNNLLFGRVIEQGNIVLLQAITIFMVCVSISTLLMESIKSLLITRVNTKVSLAVEAATMMRILSLPPEFFKKYSSGELGSRSQQVRSLCSLLVSAVLGTGLTSLFSLLYITQIFAYAPTLVIPALVIILITLVFSLLTTFVRMYYSKRQMELGAKESGMSYSLITGIQKIRLSGAEKRAYARWASLFAQQIALSYHPPMFLRANSAFSMLISLTGTLVMYALSLKSGLQVAEYYAFNTAYAMISGAFMSLTDIVCVVADIKPVMDMAKPLLDTVPEVSHGKTIVEQLSGSIELNNVSFRYNENMPLVIDDLTLKIRPGQYVAIVGSTGCGKSTLMRLMLGFEKPHRGSVYYDGKDLNTIDLRSLRRRIGVVLQNGKLFQGDIFSNITISAPWLTLEDAWRAAEMAGIAEDIRRMPMGMHTLVSEGGGGVSGGQRQRLMIARAVAPNPKILMFDEATSALDNITQKIVSDSLDKLKCTRIVIAHRLSTIRQCDRIIYLEKGKIVEDGTYRELIAKKGRFAELVERQRLDI